MGDGPNSLLSALVSGALALYLRLVYATSRWTVAQEPPRQGPAIIAFWHARLAGMPHVFRHLRSAHMLISAHRDGELIARTIEKLGFSTVRGSTARQKPGDARPTDKGGAAALRRLIRILKEGGFAGITPDGPRGPRMRVSPGTITLAALSGAPIIAVSCSSSRALRFKSWDRFLLPLPFGHFHVAFGQPLNLPEQLDENTAAQARRALEDRLNRLTEACDRAAGQEPILPAPETEGEADARKIEQIP